MKRHLHWLDVFGDALRYAIVWVSVFVYLIAALDHFVLKPHFKDWQQLIAQYFYSSTALFAVGAVTVSLLLVVRAWRDRRIRWDEYE